MNWFEIGLVKLVLKSAHGRFMSNYAQWWRHQMETFSPLLGICAGNSPVPGKFPAQKPVTRNFDFFFICARMNCWINNRESGDLRRHRAHHNVIVMTTKNYGTYLLTHDQISEQTCIKKVQVPILLIWLTLIQTWKSVGWNYLPIPKLQEWHRM